MPIYSLPLILQRYPTRRQEADPLHWLARAQAWLAVSKALNCPHALERATEALDAACELGAA